LKVLFSAKDCLGSNTAEPELTLERNEVIALVNLLERLSQSIEVVREMSLQLADRERHPRGLGAIEDVTHESLNDVLRQSLMSQL
jgi:ERO1-like protein alpha